MLVTGAGSGLGRAIAAAAVASGWRVLCTDVDGAAAARTAEELGAAGASALDVRSDADWELARDWCHERFDGLDVLVNNAGVAGGGRIDAVPVEDWAWILEVNLLGAVRGIRTFVPGMKRQGSGHVVNVASLAGLLNPPVMASYNVSKAGVVALSETLRGELAPYGIGTTVVCPGFFPTNLGASLRTPDAAIEGLVHKLMGSSPITADDVAGRVVAAIGRGRFLVLTERSGRVAWATKRFVPALYVRRIEDAATRLRAKLDASAQDTETADASTSVSEPSSPAS
ncbi:SDR family oxidoreductase [Nitriliruptoraceae bacterium ZYF776]|nr:SDR family oxidoreductase [Profundirhabdus halotolerans]